MRTVTEKSTVLRVVHLEDNSLDAEIIQWELERAGIAHSMTQVCTKKEFEGALGKGGIDLVLSDSQLPGFDTLEALARTRELRPNVPFIFVSGAISPEQKARAISQGATDFIQKDELPKLVSRVKRLSAAKKGKPASAWPEMGEPVIVRCRHFSCLGYLDKRGKWREFRSSKELQEVVDWAEL